jgi:hypothetical protein
VLARREGRDSEALQSSLSLLRVSHAASHGGLLGDQLTGAAIQRQAIRELEGPLLPTLSSEDARRTISELERLERDREPFEMIAARDLEFALSRQGLRMRVTYMINRRVLDGLLAPALKASESAEKESRGRSRILLIKLALHAYALDHPERPHPADLRSLVPSYLAEVPLSPGNERPLTLGDIRPEPPPPQSSAETNPARD